MPVPEPLQEIIESIPWPLDKKQPILHGISAKGMNTAISRAFDAASEKTDKEYLGAYSSKYLRRMVSSLLLDIGCSEYWIKNALSHSETSKQTDKYPSVYDDTFQKCIAQAFG